MRQGQFESTPDVMKFIRKTPRAFMVLDLHPGTDDKIRVQQNLPFANENMYIFQ